MTSYILTHNGERVVTQGGDTLIWDTIKGFAAAIASSTMTVAARRIGQGAGSVPAGGGLAASARRIAPGASAASAMSSLNVAARRLANGAVAINGIGNVAGAALRVACGAGAVTAAAIVAISARRYAIDQIVMGAVGAANAAARRIACSNAAITATIVMDQLGGALRSATAAILAGATVRMQGRRRWESCAPQGDAVWTEQSPPESSWE